MSAISQDAQLRRLIQKHRAYDDRLEELSRRRFPSEQERHEKATLKKMKLKVKDEMEAILRQAAGLAGRHG